jgi:Fur family ferric uptake transcriptional regulator
VRRQQLIRNGDGIARGQEALVGSTALPHPMTVVHPSPPLPARTLDAAVAALRAGGLRVSAARRLVLGALYAADGPVSAEGIAGGLEGRLPVSDLASVYRNLETLEQLGLVRHCHLGHGPGLYLPTGTREREYLVCDSCSSVSAVDPAQMDAVRALIRERFGYDAHFTHFPILGLCADCSARRPEPHPREEQHGCSTCP